jgi:hypothetical protein
MAVAAEGSHSSSARNFSKFYTHLRGTVDSHGELGISQEGTWVIIRIRELSFR